MKTYQITVNSGAPFFIGYITYYIEAESSQAAKQRVIDEVIQIDVVEEEGEKE